MVANNIPQLLTLRDIIFTDDTLPAAGAFTDSDELPVSNADYVNFFIEYVRGGAGGAVDIRFEFSPYATDALATADGVEAWFQDSAYAVGAVAAGVETTSLVQRERVTYQAQGATRETFIIQMDVKKGMERVKLSVAESGNVGAPGDLQVTAFVGIGS